MDTAQKSVAWVERGHQFPKKALLNAFAKKALLNAFAKKAPLNVRLHQTQVLHELRVDEDENEDQSRDEGENDDSPVPNVVLDN